MPDLTPDPATDALLREMAQSSLAHEAAAVDTEADLAALRERLAGVTSPVPATRGRPAAARWLAAAAAAVLIIAGVTAIAWTRRGSDDERVAPPTPTGATTVPSPAPPTAASTTATTTATTNASATTPETALPPSGTATAEPTTVAAGSELTITPAGTIQRACDDIVTTIQLDDSVGSSGLVIDGRWEFAPNFDVTSVTYPACDGAMTDAPLTFVVPTDMPTGRYVMCLITAPPSINHAMADPGCAIVTVTEEVFPACWTEPVAPPTLTNFSAPGEAAFTEQGWARWGEEGSPVEVQQMLGVEPNSWWHDDPRAQLPRFVSGPIRASVGGMSDNPAAGQVVLLRGADGCDRAYVLPTASPVGAIALAEQWVNNLADRAAAECLESPVAPPSLVDGSPPGEASVDGEVFTWGESANAVRQVLAEQPFGSFDEVAAEVGVVHRNDYGAVAVEVGDGAIGQIAILIRDDRSGCVRWYSVGPGVEPSVANGLAQQWVNWLGGGNIGGPHGGSELLQGLGYLADGVLGTYSFASDGTLLAGPYWEPPSDRLSISGSSITLLDGRRATVEVGVGACYANPLIYDDSGEIVHPDLAAIDGAVAAGNTIVSHRQVCPSGDPFDPDNRGEWFVVDLGDPAAAPRVIGTHRPSSDDPVATWELHARPVSISDDGAYFGLWQQTTTETGYFEVRSTADAREPLALPTSCDGPGTLDAAPTFLPILHVVVARTCSPGEPVRIEVIDLVTNTLVWSQSHPEHFRNGYSGTTDFDVARTADGSFVVIAEGALDTDYPTRAFVLSAAGAAEITQPGLFAYRFVTE